MVDAHNELVKAFRMSRDRFEATNFVPVSIRLIGTWKKDPAVYNLSTASEVVVLIVGDMWDTSLTRDVVVERKSTGLQRINKLHPAFMAMQYALLFPYGEDDLQIGIKYCYNEGRRQTQRSIVIMREYYTYRIQQRLEESKTIFCSGRLFQQHLVDACTCIEEDRLRWIRLNQLQVRA